MVAFAAAATAGTALLQLMMDAQARQQQQAIAQANLNFQRQQAAQQFQLATANRTDQFGNVQRYTPGIGFEFDLTPTSEAISGAQQQEQLRALTEDAQRNREASQRQDRRARAADPIFSAMLNRFESTPQPNREATTSDLQGKIFRAREEGVNKARDALAMVAARAGEGRQFGSILDSSEDLLRKMFDTSQLEAETTGREFHQQDLGNRAGSLQEIMHLATLAGRSGDVPLNAFTGNAGIGSTGGQNSMLDAMLQAMRSGGSNVGSASQTLAKIAGNSLDVTQLGNVLAQLQFGNNAATSSTVPLNRQVGDTSFGSGTSGGNFTPFIRSDSSENQYFS